VSASREQCGGTDAPFSACEDCRIVGRNFSVRFSEGLNEQRGAVEEKRLEGRCPILKSAELVLAGKEQRKTSSKTCVKVVSSNLQAQALTD
jgi:hypothetical protein